jgi:pimeloyl-ACP methyl ester carboxylesterase
MIFKEYGDRSKPTIIFIHGGGLSDWMWKEPTAVFEKEYHIVTPILDGHGEESDIIYQSISKCARQVVQYIDENCGGKVFAICGLSVGAQITVEILSLCKNITQKAVIESALVLPSKSMERMVKPSLDLSWFLVKRRWFAKLQAKQLYLPDSMFEEYFRDSVKMKKESMINLMEDNQRYTIPAGLEKTTAEVLVLCGAKEYAAMKKSAALLKQTIPHGGLEIIAHCGHGVSIQRTKEYCNLLQEFFQS